MQQLDVGATLLRPPNGIHQPGTEFLRTYSLSSTLLYAVVLFAFTLHRYHVYRCTTDDWREEYIIHALCMLLCIGLDLNSAARAPDPLSEFFVRINTILSAVFFTAFITSCARHTSRALVRYNVGCNAVLKTALPLLCLLHLLFMSTVFPGATSGAAGAMLSSVLYTVVVKNLFVLVAVYRLLVYAAVMYRHGTVFLDGLHFLRVDE